MIIHFKAFARYLNAEGRDCVELRTASAPKQGHAAQGQYGAKWMVTVGELRAALAVSPDSSRRFERLIKEPIPPEGQAETFEVRQEGWLILCVV